MRSLILGLAGAAALAVATPAVAQVHVDGPGVRVHVNDGNHHNRWHRGYRARAQSNCRQVTTRTVRPNGAVVVKRVTRC